MPAPCPHCGQPLPDQPRRDPPLAPLEAMEREALYRLLNRFGLQGPPGDMDTLAAIISSASAPAAVLVTFGEAEDVGQRLHDHFHAMSGSAPLDREDLGWADTVQFVLRTARNVVDGRLKEGGDGR